jgi:hypothetical protein
MDLIFCYEDYIANMETNIRNAIIKTNAEFNYGLEVEITHVEHEPWYAKIYDTASMIRVEFLERDGGVIASVMERFNITTARLTRIMDVLMEFMPISPPGGD